MKTTTPEPFRHVLVALDLTEMDDTLIRYADMVAKLLPIERIFFVYVAKNLELPPDLLEEYPDLMAPLDESIQVDLQKKVNDLFTTTSVEVSCIVEEGNAIEKVLKLCKIKHIDLILMGRKKSLKGSGIVSSKIARRCPCSLLLVTENFSPNISKVLVPVDFSGHAAHAMQRASEFATPASAELMMMHIFDVPVGYYKTGKSHEEFARIMQSHAEKDCQKFLKKNQFPADVACEYEVSDDGKAADMIYHHAEESGVDLIVLGSKGRTALSAILMGSVAEKLVYRDSGIPVLIVKNKGENMGFINALLKI
ncbi:MAG: universal stress protein [Cyclobacteriaceae bacterium]